MSGKIYKLHPSTGNITLKSDSERIRNFLGFPRGDRYTERIHIAVTGFEGYCNYAEVCQALRTVLFATKDYFPEFLTVDGTGVSRIVRSFAEEGNLPVKVFYTEKDIYLEGAREIRDGLLLDAVKAAGGRKMVLAFHDKGSDELGSAVEMADKMGLPIILVSVNRR